MPPLFRTQPFHISPPTVLFLFRLLAPEVTGWSNRSWVGAWLRDRRILPKGDEKRRAKTRGCSAKNQIPKKTAQMIRKMMGILPDGENIVAGQLDGHTDARVTFQNSPFHLARYAEIAFCSGVKTRLPPDAAPDDVAATALVTAEASDAIVLSTSCVMEVTGVPAATKVVGIAVGRMSEAGEPVASMAVCTSVTIVARDMAMFVRIDVNDIASFGSAQQ
jgi:hypothetical protein